LSLTGRVDSCACVQGIVSKRYEREHKPVARIDVNVVNPGENVIEHLGAIDRAGHF